MPSAYAYKAALYCESCGDKIERELKIAGVTDTGDTNDYPQGPFAQGGGEADTPQHCEECGEFLENPITSDGDRYVREKLQPFYQPSSSWDETAKRAEDAGKPILGQWARFYYAESQ